MRKRAQRKSKIPEDEHSYKLQKEISGTEKRKFSFNKKWWTAISLIGIFFLIIVLNTYFNVSSGTTINTELQGLDQYYLSGPDPYYNMRLVDETLYGENAGQYPFYSEGDPLLNYPIGRSGSRAPLFNMMAIGFSRLLIPFMNEIDAIGYSMQFIPALFGALLIFPIYFIGKTLFGKKEGLLAALLIALIPIHLSSGHGSAYTLFDHDSFNLFLFFTTFLFIIWSIKEKNLIKSLIYAALAGIPLAALTMTWVEAQYLYVIIAIYAIVQMILDIFYNKQDLKIPISTTATLFIGYILSLPIIISKWGSTGFRLDIPLFLCIFVAIFGLLYFIFDRKKLPWTISLPFVGLVGIVSVSFLFLIRNISTNVPLLSSLTKLSRILFGTGIYGSKVSSTIAEAGTYSISRTVMSFGPALYWIGLIGFIFLIYFYLKNIKRRDYLFIIVVFLITMWLVSLAGRFLNDLVPLIAILAAWIIIYIINKSDYKNMIRNIKNAGGGFRGIRRGISFLHIFGILFVALLVILPNTYLAFDAAIPGTEKENVFGDLPSGGFGISLAKEAYWLDALAWLKEQDSDIENSVEKPAFISWWDYGFYEAAIGDHPTVADNFQDGIPPAANFHTSTSEKDAVIILTVRLLAGNVIENKGVLSEEVVQELENNLGINNSMNITYWIENPEESPSYNMQIGLEYDEELGKDYPVGQQWPMNAVYHDVVDLLSNISDETVTMLYHDIQITTGKSIRYYGVEGYDKQIFNIFAYLSDKSLLLVSGGGLFNPEDEFVNVKYVTQSGQELSFEELNQLTDQQLQQDPPVDTRQFFKDAYYDTMFYRTYIGIISEQDGTIFEPDYQLPCMNMKHFYAEYISPPEYMYYQGKGAVVIAKYYAGAFINGSVSFNGEPVDVQVVVQKNITQYGTEIPVDHDQNITTNGTFSVIAPAGNITLQIRRNVELGQNAFVLKNVTFNQFDKSEYAIISDNEAMRMTDNYSRYVDISIDPASIEGFVYIDQDENDFYNISSDEILKDVDINIIEISEIDPNTGQPLIIGEFMNLKTDDGGYFNTSNLMPGFYLIQAILDDFLIHESFLGLPSGNTFYNISKPKEGAVEGTIYFDDNNNGLYDSGEEMNDVEVELDYSLIEGSIKIVDTLITDDDGKYSFYSLIPGPYTINAVKNLDYSSDTTITVIENETLKQNISMNYATILLSGNTKEVEANDLIDNVTINFIPDFNVGNNTAEEISIQSDEKSVYSVDIKPGTYNVVVNQTIEENNVTYRYIYIGNLEIEIGEGLKTLDIMITKVEEA
ncbi:MAG: STT3 domain-containing protein [Candidatus Thermoplasmatota archaeon]